MLNRRLLFGTLMTVFFTVVVILDGWLDGSLTESAIDDKSVQGTILCILVALLAIPAQLEFSRLAAAKKLKIFTPFSIVASILFATAWYWTQMFEVSLGIYVVFLSVFTVFGLFLYQYFCYGTSSVIANCGVNFFSIIYLGLLSAFVPAVRIDFGLWALLMFVFVVKSSDIGAYTIGKLFGRHKFSPLISPGKTWEGMAGALIFGVIVSVLFNSFIDIIAWWNAVIFGLCLAVTGQLGDLAESMIKRDAEQKDSSNNVPGFGGILDVIDSPLATACIAYIFFRYCSL